MLKAKDPRKQSSKFKQILFKFLTIYEEKLLFFVYQNKFPLHLSEKITVKSILIIKYILSCNSEKNDTEIYMHMCMCAWFFVADLQCLWNNLCSFQLNEKEYFF